MFGFLGICVTLSGIEMSSGFSLCVETRAQGSG
jgi:hypothetical protein